VRTHRFLLVNPRSGDGSPSAEELAEAAQELGIEVHLLAEGENPAEIARASGAGTLGMAGGDGSLAAVAGVALETEAAFVCVPFGTRNHFARDAGLDRDDPLDALRAFTDGVERRIDVGRVGDRYFLNNVALGVYARLVHRRERRRRRGEALARLRALAAVARHRHRLRLQVNGAPLLARAVLVGNNAYRLSLFTLGERDRLDEGVLQLGVAEGWLPRTWHDRLESRLVVELETPRIRAAIDGEPATLETPLRFTSLPGALRLLVPAEGGAMHDNPEPTEEEQEEAQSGRLDEEESMRYPSDAQPDAPDDASE
jgi:diacylglycerol kinase family enzyme